MKSNPCKVNGHDTKWKVLEHRKKCTKLSFIKTQNNSKLCYFSVLKQFVNNNVPQLTAMDIVVKITMIKID